jgi:leucyl aminopeptidase
VLHRRWAPRLAATVQLLVEGALLGSYKFARYLTGEDAKKPSPLTSFGIITDAKGKKPLPPPRRKQVLAAIDRGQTVARAVAKARDSHQRARRPS